MATTVMSMAVPVAVPDRFGFGVEIVFLDDFRCVELVENSPAGRNAGKGFGGPEHAAQRCRAGHAEEPGQERPSIHEKPPLRFLRGTTSGGRFSHPASH